MSELLERTSRQVESFDSERRRYNDTVTWLAEVLPGHMRTPFEYHYDGNELHAEDGGALKPIFKDAIKRAESLPPYEQRRRWLEMDEYHDMIAMMRGDLPNTMVVVSDFPPELMTATEDVGGYNVTRKQTMLRVIIKTPEGRLRMYSQSLDGSNRQALEDLYGHLGNQPEKGELLGQRMHLQLENCEQEFLVDELMGVYDRSLARQLGGEWHAGRRDRPPINTYDFVRQQSDLLSAYLGTTDQFTGGTADYNLAAAMRARYDQGRHPTELTGVPHFERSGSLPISAFVMAMAEMKGAGNIARQIGVTFSGCGKTITGNAEGSRFEDQLEEAGYGNQADKLPDDKYGSRYFKCPKGHQNTRPHNQLIERCKTCGTSVRC